MSKKILILDDSEDILELMRDVLEMEGYEVETLNYTNDICKAAMEFNADLVILDYILFGINGGELCHMLKTNPVTAHIPVVMVSAYPRVLESLGSYGSDAFVAKPFDLIDIVGTVQGCLLKAGDIEHV